MRRTPGSARWTRWLGILLVATLFFAPATWATGEEVREQADEESAAEKKDAADGSAAPAKPEAESCEPGVLKTFGTIEEIRAFRGQPAELWTSRATPGAPAVIWHEVERPSESR